MASRAATDLRPPSVGTAAVASATPAVSPFPVGFRRTGRLASCGDHAPIDPLPCRRRPRSRRSRAPSGLRVRRLRSPAPEVGGPVPR
ncbi:hypothetical protein DLJ57_12885, partial [Micromonospora chalcea]